MSNSHRVSGGVSECVSEWMQINDPLIQNTGTQWKTSLSHAKNGKKKIKVEKNFFVVILKIFRHWIYEVRLVIKK